MLYTKVCSDELSLLGFGAMRLPTLADGSIDVAQVRTMTEIAMENGVNYYDTAWPYHSGQSETVMGEILHSYPRESFRLASKYPGHQIAASYDPKAVFEKQLEKCQVSYFDYYLLHNVYENSIKTYTDKQWGIMNYFIEQKRLGRIHHLGFSSHGGLPILRQFLDRYGEHLEFCQLQINYLDWTLQDAKAKYDLLTEYGLPVWVMEPVRGGKLAKLSEENSARLHALRPNETDVDWCFRFLQELPNVHMILSGMSSIRQMEENITSFKERKPLSENEFSALMQIADSMKNGVPCTGCRYCCDGCPIGLDIPMLLGIYNEIKVAPVMNTGMRVEALPDHLKPSACVNCGQCTSVCPQGISVPQVMAELTELLKTVPSWAETCKKRALAQK